MLHASAIHFDWQQWSAVVATIGAALFGLQRIVLALGALVTEISSLHTTLLITFGEHEIMAEDYAIRRNITRHNLRKMAYALAKLGANGKGHENGTTKSKGAVN